MRVCRYHGLVVFFNDTATTEIYTLSLHDALPILRTWTRRPRFPAQTLMRSFTRITRAAISRCQKIRLRSSQWRRTDRKSTRLNSSHANISYAVFCLKKKQCRFELSKDDPYQLQSL